MLLATARTSVGRAALPESENSTTTGPSSPAWGDDGGLAFSVLLRYHSFVDMTKRWVYHRPVEK